MRNALILLVVVALIILVAGALNNSVVFDVDYVAGTVSSVSLFWTSVVVAAVVFVAGLAAAWFALAGASGGRRKLEAELQSTYERLRQAEREATEARAAASAAATTAAAPERTVVAAPEEATVVAAEASTVVAEGSAAAADEERQTVLVDGAGQDAATLVAPPGTADTEVASAESRVEQTAVTLAGETPAPVRPQAAAAEEEQQQSATPSASPEDETSGEAPAARQ